MTLDEVLTHLSLTRDSLDKALVWSNGYELISIENTDRTITPAATVFGAPLTGAYDASLFHYAEIRSGNEVELLGIDFDELSEKFSPYCTKVQSIVTAESFGDVQ